MAKTKTKKANAAIRRAKARLERERRENPNRVQDYLKQGDNWLEYLRDVYRDSLADDVLTVRNGQG